MRNKISNNGKYTDEHFLCKEGKMLCAECNEWLPIYMFSKRNSTKRGYNMCCKRCYGKQNFSYDINKEWRDVIGYEGVYRVSIDGEIISLERSFVVNGNNVYLPTKKLSQRPNHNGYMTAILSKNGKNKTILVHRIVAIAFIDNPDNFDCINHKNEIKTDNRIENLEWCDRLYNNNYGTRNKRISQSNKGMKLSKECLSKRSYTLREKASPVAQFDVGGNFIKSYNSIIDAMESTGINHIYSAMHRRGTSGGYYWMQISNECHIDLAGMRSDITDGQYFTHNKTGDLQKCVGSFKFPATQAMYNHRATATEIINYHKQKGVKSNQTQDSYGKK